MRRKRSCIIGSNACIGDLECGRKRDPKLNSEMWAGSMAEPELWLVGVCGRAWAYSEYTGGAVEVEGDVEILSREGSGIGVELSS